MSLELNATLNQFVNWATQNCVGKSMPLALAAELRGRLQGV